MLKQNRIKFAKQPLNYSQQNAAQVEIDNAESTLEELKQQVSILEDEVDIQSYGLYEPKYDFGESSGN